MTRRGCLTTAFIVTVSILFVLYFLIGFFMTKIIARAESDEYSVTVVQTNGGATTSYGLYVIAKKIRDFMPIRRRVFTSYRDDSVGLMFVDDRILAITDIYYGTSVAESATLDSGSHFVHAYWYDAILVTNLADKELLSPYIDPLEESVTFGLIPGRFEITRTDSCECWTQATTDLDRSLALICAKTTISSISDASIVVFVGVDSLAPRFAADGTLEVETSWSWDEPKSIVRFSVSLRKKRPQLGIIANKSNR